MTETTSTDTQVTPQQQAFNNAISAWGTSLQDQGDDANSLHEALLRLEKLPPDAAFVQMSMLLSSGGIQVQGDKVSILASLMNTGSAGSGLSTEITSDINSLGSSSGTGAEAADLVDAVGFLKSQMQNQLSLIQAGGPQGPGVWIDGSTANSVLSACNSITTLLGSSDPTTVAKEIGSWATDPTAKASNGRTGSQNLQALNGFVATTGNAFGGFNQMQNNALQFQDNQIGQMVTSARSLLQDIVSLVRAAVAASKGS
jgi:hypothetical protein